ncbi:major facilitator superfamily permease [Streptococcus pneumoniae]|nr:major facilitator superfamily permease [Streptococcus pneumoniae]CJE73372.1 major facilitator superfamily permease [Streptococcus pneumoniae]VJF20170.1 major facilitator superfamily permease [Streptococcus pneumoniae]VKC15717.1 major facilitator superfamily permease [Streptococcus pneumoniae]VKH09693.1 major facilitator superfamily permease [Streptococcus pneumoniae]
MKLFWTNNIYRQLLLNSCFSSFGDSIFYLAIINYVAQYNFAPLAILLISISEMVPLLSQLFLGILGDFQENRVKHALWIAKIKILLYAILTVFLVLSPFSLVSVIMIVIINLISDTLSYLSAYMMNALYISVIKDDLHDAMGFRQSLMRVVRIVANLAGAFLINVISIQTISLINTLTFVIAFLGLYVIRHTLYEVEKRIEMSHTALSFKKYFQHLKQSLAVPPEVKRYRHTTVSDDQYDCHLGCVPSADCPPLHPTDTSTTEHWATPRPALHHHVLWSYPWQYDQQ